MVMNCRLYSRIFQIYDAARLYLLMFYPIVRRIFFKERKLTLLIGKTVGEFRIIAHLAHSTRLSKCSVLQSELDKILPPVMLRLCYFIIRRGTVLWICSPLLDVSSSYNLYLTGTAYILFHFVLCCYVFVVILYN